MITSQIVRTAESVFQLLFYAAQRRHGEESKSEIPPKVDPKEEEMYSKITQDGIAKLDTIDGFQWYISLKWNPFEQRLEEHKQFQKEQGHGIVPQ